MKISVGGLTGAGETLDDVTSGRYVDRFQLGPMSGAEGFDGTVAWSQDASGQSRAEQGGDGGLRAANESYRRAYGYWRPGRWPARIEDAGAQAPFNVRNRGAGSAAGCLAALARSASTPRVRLP